MSDLIDQLKPVRRRGGIVVWDGPRDAKPVQKRVEGPKEKSLLYQWTDDDILDAHKAYNNGNRSLWAREGERVYSRSRKRKQRARRDWIEWAERAAVAQSWEAATVYYTSESKEMAA